MLKKNPDDGADAQHLTWSTGGDNKFQCFKCGLSNLGCDRAKNYKFTKEEDSSDVNNQNAIDQKFKEFKDAKKKRTNVEEVSGAMHTIHSDEENTPRWDEILDVEEGCDGNVLKKWVFNHDGVRIDQPLK